MSNNKVLFIDSASIFNRFKLDKKENYLSSLLILLREIVDDLKPTEAYIVVGEKSYQREKLMPTYRKKPKLKESDTEIVAELTEVWEKSHKALEFVKNFIPMPVFKSPMWESKDVIAYMKYQIEQNNHDDEKIEFVVVTNDDDFLGLDDVQVYDFVQKDFLKKPTYNHWKYKALIGDKKLNIKGVPGVPKKRVPEITKNSKTIREFLDTCDTVQQDAYNLNYKVLTPFCGTSPENFVIYKDGTDCFDFAAFIMEHTRSLEQDIEDPIEFAQSFHKISKTKEKVGGMF